MTPGGRIAAAIEILDAIGAGAPAEKALTTWARRHRFAGSADRRAIRDHVFDVIRCRRSSAALGGGATGRALMIGSLRAAGHDPGETFTGEGHAPPPLSSEERVPPGSLADRPRAVRLDYPDWLDAPLSESLDSDLEPVMTLLRRRAPVHLRVNLLRADVASARAALADDGIVAEPHALATTALEVREGAARLRTSAAYRDGLVELQDAASQAVVAALGPVAGDRVLDYCAGGGGKALALAAFGAAEVAAHDADPGRMADLPGRAARSGARIALRTGADLASLPPWDLVLADAPCSGSGAWRRQPEAKWHLTRDGLDRLCQVQAGILDAAAMLVRPGGRLGYATCSILSDENTRQVDAFLDRSRGWRVASSARFLPTAGGDGFFLAVLKRESA